MEKKPPPSLEEFIRNEDSLPAYFGRISLEYRWKIARMCVEVHKRHENHMHSQAKKYCAICDKELIDEDAKYSTDYDFNLVCKEHKEYACAFQVDRIRQRLGFAERKILPPLPETIN